MSQRGEHDGLAGHDAPPPGAPPSLRRGAALTILGAGFLNLCRFAVVSLLAKFASDEVVGAYDLANSALAAPLVLFLALELRAAYVADARRQFTFGAYRALRSAGMATAALLVLATVLWQRRGEPLAALTLLMVGVGFCRAAFMQGEIYWGVFQRRERLDWIAWSSIWRGLALVAPPAVLLPLSEKGAAFDPQQAALVAVLVQLVAWLSLTHFYDRRLALTTPALDLRWSAADLWKLALHAAPLGLVMLIITLCESVPRWVIAATSDDDALANVGYFGALRVVTLAAGMIVVQTGTAAGNRLVAYYQRDLRAFVRLTCVLTAVAGALGAAIVALALLGGEWFLRVVYTADYARYADEFTLLVVAQAALLLASVFGFVVTHMREFWIQVPLQLAVLAATTVAALLLIPDDPIRGGAQAALIRAGVQTALYLACVVFAVRRRWKRGAGGL